MLDFSISIIMLDVANFVSPIHIIISIGCSKAILFYTGIPLRATCDYMVDENINCEAVLKHKHFLLSGSHR